MTGEDFLLLAGLAEDGMTGARISLERLQALNPSSVPIAQALLRLAEAGCGLGTRSRNKLWTRRER